MAARVAGAGRPRVDVTGGAAGQPAGEGQAEADAVGSGGAGGAPLPFCFFLPFRPVSDSSRAAAA